jgi:hypothetical protein
VAPTPTENVVSDTATCKVSLIQGNPQNPGKYFTITDACAVAIGASGDANYNGVAQLRNGL